MGSFLLQAIDPNSQIGKNLGFSIQVVQTNLEEMSMVVSKFRQSHQTPITDSKGNPI